MPRFFLLDSWLANAKGHNYQYALDVAGAAQERGYEPVLAVRRMLAPEIQFPPSWRIERVFHFGESPRHSIGIDGRNPHPCDLHGNWLSDSTIRWWEPWIGWHARIDRRRRIARFADDCTRLFAKVAPQRDDILFLPSLTDFDFLCAARFWRDAAWTRDLDWHIQFHYNFFRGRDAEFPEQTAVLRRFQRQFRSAVDEIPAHRLHFYATTEAVARQYGALGIAIFHALPYPVRTLAKTEEPTPPAERSAARPLQVTLPGAMRHEKGKRQLGKLIDAVWDEFLDPGKLQLIFQSPARSVERSLPGRLRGSLRVRPVGSDGPASPLMTAPHPLDAERYAKFIQGSDIGLLLYDARRYFARVSGVLCEMLSAGVPVIVPAGCWLADQIAEENYLHVDSLRRNHAGAKCELPRTGDTGTVIRLPAQSQTILVDFDWPGFSEPGMYVELIADPIVAGQTAGEGAIREILCSREQGPVGAVLRFPTPVTAVRLAVRKAFGLGSLSVARARIVTLTACAPAADPPQARVGLIAADEREIPRLLREMVTHYDHYRRTAREFSRLWQCQHSPGSTLEMLASRTQHGVAPSRSDAA